MSNLLIHFCICNLECLFHLWKLWNFGEALFEVYMNIVVNIDNFSRMNNKFDILMGESESCFVCGNNSSTDFAKCFDLVRE